MSMADTVIACKLIFHATKIGSRDLTGHIETLRGTQYPNPALPELRRVVSLGLGGFHNPGVEVQPYNTFTSNGLSVFMNNATLERAERKVTREDVVNLQFTSGKRRTRLHILLLILTYFEGTTGSPKAAMLTHT
jgi:hypothetical protein